jgi:single-strand DNA-binding protein
MKSINQVTLLGNLTKDIELRYTPNGSAVINFSMATNRSYKDKQTDEWKEVPEFHNVVFWGKPAEIIDQYCSKGDKILVQGRLQTRNWEDKSGVKKYMTEIVGEDFILLSTKEDSKIRENQSVNRKEIGISPEINKKAEEIFEPEAEDDEDTADPVEDFQRYLDSEDKRKKDNLK